MTTPTNGRQFIPISKPIIGEEEKAAVMDVLDSGMLVQGPRVAKLEDMFAKAIGVSHAIATSSGTTALHLALLAHGVGPGDEVVTSPFTFIASVNSIIYTGARPVFADIDERTFNMDPARVEAAITDRTKVIMPVHLYGLPADMSELLALAERGGLAIVEDCAQSIGATYGDRVTGSFGTGCFSLYATKNVQSGEGGMVTTDDEALAERVRLLRQHGMKARYQYIGLGYNFRMTDLHAALGIPQMGRLTEITNRRRQNAEFLNHHIESATTPVTPAGREHVWHQYTVRLPAGLDRDRAVERLAAEGVGTGIFYPRPAHLFDHVREAAGGQPNLPVSEAVARDVLSLPVHPSLSREDLERIAAAVNAL